MPTRAPSVCIHPGCHTLVHGGGRCPAHQRAKWKQQDAKRGTRSQRGYDNTWLRIAAWVLREEPLCRFCAEAGRTTRATEVDHIDGNVWNRARENLRPLCKSCHSRRTARDQAFGRKAAQR